MLAVSDSVLLGLIVGLVVVIIALIPKRSLSAQLGKMAVTLGSIDLNTNHQPQSDDGSPPKTMSAQVREIGKDMKALSSTVSEMHDSNMMQHTQNLEQLSQHTTELKVHSDQIATLVTELATLTETVRTLPLVAMQLSPGGGG